MEQTQLSSQSEAPPEKARLSSAIPAAKCQDHGDSSKIRDEAVREELSTLCSRCSSIDIESLVVDMKGEDRVIKLMSLGKLGVEAELSSCSLCRLFHAVRIQDDDYPSVDDYALYLALHRFLQFPLKGLVLAVAPAGHAIEGYDGLLYLERKGASRGFIAYSEESDTDPHAHLLRVRSIDARAIDFNILRGWVQLCVQQHKQNCVQDESSTSSLKDMKLIDCELRQTVPASPSYKYAALSYVWGTSKSGDENECIDNILPTTLPRIIEDAMSVTKALGLRYIWTDRYCIDQGNDTEKQIQIQQMDLIYQHAFVTIVAAAGTDPHFGLPGVGATSRPPQPTAWIKGRCLVSTLRDPRQLIKASKWMQRAWTYQENFFSARRIVFTEQQVYYECRGGTAQETLHAFLNIGMSHFLDPPALGGDNPTNICSLLEGYCGRELSVDSDAIRAFQGVFHNYWRRHHVHQYLGIPIVPLAIAFGYYGSLKSSHRSRGEAFVAGLSWCNGGPGTRRSLFPTWSWAEWTVPITYEGSLCFLGLKLGNEKPLKVFIESCDGSLLDMDNVSDALLYQGIPGSSDNFIHIEAWTIPIDVRYLSNGTEELQYHDYLYADGSGYLVRFQTDEEAVQVPMCPLHQQNCTPDFKECSLLGIVLGRCEDFSDLDWSDVIFIMVVQEKEQYHERVGHIFLEQSFEEFQLNGFETPQSLIRKWQTIFHSKERRTIRLG